MRGTRRFAVVLSAAAALAAAPIPAQQAEATAEARELRLDWGFEAKAHYRDSEHLRLPSPFPFPPGFLPPGAQQGFMETVNEGRHFELSVLTLFADLAWGENLAAHAKVDLIDLHDRNPTSSDKKVDVDELWIRFGRDPALPASGFGLYAKIGKFAHFERQNDRHLESYGLVATALKRFEDQGLELGADFGRHVYLRLSATQGNPLFLRDPNALAGDNGTPELDPQANPNPDPALKSGFTILYDAEVEDLDVDGDLETGAGLGVRFGDPDEGRAFDLLAWSYERKLAPRVALEGTYYGGDLDLLDGPDGVARLPISGDDKSEVGGNLRIHLGGFSLFGQYVAQEIAGMDRTGYEAELAWRFELPLVWAVGGRQLFPSIQPALRWSRLEPEFEGGSPRFPAPSVRWEWVKLDYGIRMAIIEGVDLTLEFADHTMTLANGREVSNDELLTTLRWRVR
ncbi:MAG: hypothetical protein K8H90_05380 [Thermoanaerobaculia bacterium]|nr:hypothetical protein [Thermoanaerobaculia bacterium]